MVLRAQYCESKGRFSELDENPEEIDARLLKIKMEFQGIEQQSLVLNPPELNHAGVRQDKCTVYLRYGKIENKPHKTPEFQLPVNSIRTRRGRGRQWFSGRQIYISSAGETRIRRGQPNGADLIVNEDEGPLEPLPERVVVKMAGHRNLTPQMRTADQKDFALTLLLMKFVVASIRTFGYRTDGLRHGTSSLHRATIAT
jgi:hypothetical protein